MGQGHWEWMDDCVVKGWHLEYCRWSRWDDKRVRGRGMEKWNGGSMVASGVCVCETWRL